MPLLHISSFGGRAYLTSIEYDDVRHISTCDLVASPSRLRPLQGLFRTERKLWLISDVYDIIGLFCHSAANTVTNSLTEPRHWMLYLCVSRVDRIPATVRSLIRGRSASFVSLWRGHRNFSQLRESSGARHRGHTSRRMIQQLKFLCWISKVDGQFVFKQ